MTLFAEVVATSGAVAATTKRNEKRATLAELLGRLDPDEIAVVTGFLVGEVRQGRIGVGWASVRDLEHAGRGEPELSVADIDLAVTALAGTSGAGSQAARHAILRDLADRATDAETEFLRKLFIGELRQGALAGVLTDAVAVAAGVPLAAVRRAAMLSSDLGLVATLALTDGADALDAIGLRPLHPVEPMLASTSASVTEALSEVGEASVEWKLDGARIQVHRAGDEVRVYTRNLNDVTDRLPEVVAVARSLPSPTFVLDGEVLGFLGPDDAAPQAFQDTMSRFGRDDAASSATVLAPWFFDVLHLDGADLLDTPLAERRRRLGALAPDHVIPGRVTTDASEGEAVLAEALERGHEGVMVKAAASPYEAGRRGKAWRKVKPVHTLDLVVLAVEWGSGRRRGWLSNLHLGALDAATGEPVMVGKTFKGLTDELLRWQTERFTALKTEEQGHVVHVRPEQVVEIALDGAQASTRYPGGVALRFARVVRYRFDKDADQADTLDAVRDLLPRGRRMPS